MCASLVQPDDGADRGRFPIAETGLSLQRAVRGRRGQARAVQL